MSFKQIHLYAILFVWIFFVSSTVTCICYLPLIDYVLSPFIIVSATATTATTTTTTTTTITSVNKWTYMCCLFSDELKDALKSQLREQEQALESLNPEVEGKSASTLSLSVSSSPSVLQSSLSS